MSETCEKLPCACRLFLSVCRSAWNRVALLKLLTGPAEIAALFDFGQSAIEVSFLYDVVHVLIEPILLPYHHAS